MASGERATRRDRSTRERFLDAGLELFAQKGFVGTTTKSIAAKAGVNEVTVFRQFGSKKGLYAAVISERSPVADIERRVSFDADAPVDQLLKENAASVLHVLRSNRNLFMLLMGDAWRSPKARSMMSQFGVEKGMAIAEELIEMLIDSGKIRRMDAQVAARALVGMIQSYFLTVDLLAGRRPDSVEDERMLSGFVDIFLDGAREGGSG